MIEDPLSTEVQTNVVRPGLKPYMVVTPFLQVAEGTSDAVQLPGIPDLWWSKAGQGPTMTEVDHAVTREEFSVKLGEWHTEYERLVDERANVRERARQQLVKVAGLDADVVEYLLGEG